MIKIISIIYQSVKNLAEKLGCVVLVKEEMKFHTSFRIGGPADLFIYVNNTESLKKILKKISETDVPFFILGNGSNLLVSDEGFRGIVLSLLKSERILRLENETTLLCSSGIPLAKACIFAMKNSLSGLEFAWGIPGSCGGALFMNAGAYGDDISKVILQGTHITLQGEEENLSKDQLALSYRKSFYSDNQFIITSLKLSLNPLSSQEIRSRMYENIHKRKSKQPLNQPNAGSIFKRPGNGYYAGTLIESCGLKGFSIGGAMVSPKHAGFIVNTGNASAEDVARLISHIKKTVYDNSGINLECEIKTLGNIKI